VKNHDFTQKNHIFPILGGGTHSPACTCTWITLTIHIYIYICDFQSNNLNLKYTYVYILLVSPSPLKLVVRISLTRSTCILDTLHVYDSLSATCDRSVVFSGYPPTNKTDPTRYNRHIVENGVKHHKPNLVSCKAKLQLTLVEQVRLHQYRPIGVSRNAIKCFESKAIILCL
jgi:hypothetical protein